MVHQPVLLAQVLVQLAIKEDGNYVDCTFGRGGHSQAILARLGDRGQLLAMDRDSDAISSDVAQNLLRNNRFHLKRSAFSGMAQWVQACGLMGQVDGVLLDLGVSSPQLDEAVRGFSFLRDGPLDMRMDTSSGLTAAEWLGQVDEKELARILRDYGEERFAKRIARAIVQTRATQELTTTGQLAALIENVVGKREPNKHPATRSFQAIRIAINNELAELEAVLAQSIPVLRKGGRLAVISFHSLEDRIVKRFIRNESGAKYDPGRLPIKQDEIPQGSLVTIGKPIKADLIEIEQNPRARSAVLRVAEKV